MTLHAASLSTFSVAEMQADYPLCLWGCVIKFMSIIFFFRQRKWQRGEDTWKGVMCTQSTGTETIHTVETMHHTTAEVATRSQQTWTREALLMTGGPNKTDRGTWQLPLTWSHLHTETTTMKDPQGCKGLSGPCTHRHVFHAKFESSVTGFIFLCKIIWQRKYKFHLTVWKWCCPCRSRDTSVYLSEGEYYEPQHRQSLYNLRYILTSRGKYIYVLCEMFVAVRAHACQHAHVVRMAPKYI